MSENNLIEININGNPYQVPGGMNLIDAVQKYASIEIPHYCYHSKLSIAGNCRMCLVEMGMPMRDRGTGEPVLDVDGIQKIGWMPKPAIACSTKTSSGLHIKTESEMVKECRNGVMEFLLVNHPLDCPICDQAGECRLQQFATDYGRGYSRFVEDKNVKPKRSRIGPRVTLDDERCILCSRCVRFSQEITKDNVLGFVDRGSYSTLTCYPGKELDNNYSLNTVDICPVGALTDTDFRFKMRVWFLKPVNSICTESSVGVNTQVWSREGKIYRITPRQNDEVNDTWMSDSGRRIYKTAESEFRLLSPAVDGKAESEGVALSRATEVLSKKELAVVTNGRASVEEQFLVKELSDKYDAEVFVVPHSREGDGFLISNDATPNYRGAFLSGLTDTVEVQADVAGRIERYLKDNPDTGLFVLNEDLTEFISQETIEKSQIVYAGTHQNKTSEAADVVIPMLTVFEKEGSFVNQNFRLQKFRKAIPGPAGVSSDLEVLAKLLLEAEGREPVNKVIKVWNSIIYKNKVFEGISFQSISDDGILLEPGGLAELNFPEEGSLHYKPLAEAETATK